MNLEIKLVIWKGGDKIGDQTESHGRYLPRPFSSIGSLQQGFQTGQIFSFYCFVYQMFEAFSLQTIWLL